MEIGTTSDVGEFVAVTDAFLRREPLRHNVITSWFADPRIRPGTVLYAVVRDGAGTVAGVATYTAGRGAYLGALPEGAARELADRFADETADVPSVEGDPDDARDFARRWTTRRGGSFRVDTELRLFRLGTLVPPSARGHARPARADDADLCYAWMLAMAAEPGMPVTPPAREGFAERIAAGSWWLWEDLGEPVCLAAHREPAYGWSRIGPVYTPAALRGHGYASALTAHIAARIRDLGAEPCLFTDLANPTSNKIYRAIGFVPVRDLTNCRIDTA